MKISRRPRQGFTLVEILITTTLLGFVTFGLFRVFIQALDVYKYDIGKLTVNRDMRRFTTEMSENATYANYFRIFASHTDLSRTVDVLVDPSDPDQGFTTAIADSSLTKGLSGDCLVLVYKDPADDRKIARLRIYFRVPGNASPSPKEGIRVTNKGPVRRIDLPITPSSSLPVFQLIPEISNPAQYPIVLQSVEVVSPELVANIPLTTPATFQKWGLFYNFNDKSIVLKGELIQTGSQFNVETKEATNTYNFTISPRG